MGKKYENNPAKAKYIKEQLKKGYPELFRKYKMENLSDIQVCNLAEFFIAEHPEKYARTPRTEQNYRNNKDLQRIYAVIDSKNNRAVMLNTSKEGKIPEGEFGVYNLEKQRLRLTNKELTQKLKVSMEKEAEKWGIIADYSDEVDKLVKRGRNLDDIDKIATMGDRGIAAVAHKIMIDQKINMKNKENGIPDSKRKEIEKQQKNKKDKEELEDQKMPKEVNDMKHKTKGGRIVRYFYVNASELRQRVDDAHVRKSGGKVLMMEIADDSRVAGPNRYYGFQDGRMVLWGNDDKDVKEVVGKVTKMGQVVKPLRIHNTQYVEYEDKNGVKVKERIEDNKSLAVGELNNFKEEMQESLEEYSKQIDDILDMDQERKDPKQVYAAIQRLDQAFDKKTSDLGRQYDINSSDSNHIRRQTDPRKIMEENGYQQEEPADVQEEADEPKHSGELEDEYDESGKLIPPGRRTRER